MTTSEMLYGEILSNPADDTVRLAYADRLEEEGDALTAEFIRYQITNKSAAVYLFRIGGWPDDQSRWERPIILQSHFEELTELGCSGVMIRRGFVDRVNINSRHWDKNWQAIKRLVPLSEIWLDWFTVHYPSTSPLEIEIGHSLVNGLPSHKKLAPKFWKMYGIRLAAWSGE